MDEQWNKIHEAKIKQLDTLNNTYNERLEEARKEYQRFTDSLYQEFESLSQQLHPLKAEKLGELNAIDYQIKLCRKEVFFEEEQQELKNTYPKTMPTSTRNGKTVSPKRSSSSRN